MDGHLLVVYKGECPMEWDWEDTQNTIQQLRKQTEGAESLNWDLYEELVWARAQIRELERPSQTPGPAPVVTCGGEPALGMSRGFLGCGAPKLPPRF